MDQSTLVRKNPLQQQQMLVVDTSTKQGSWPGQNATLSDD
jgi:hypothetical protein